MASIAGFLDVAATGVSNNTWWVDWLQTEVEPELFPRLHLWNLGKDHTHPVGSGLVGHLPYRNLANQPVSEFELNATTPEAPAPETVNLQQVQYQITGWGGRFGYQDLQVLATEVTRQFQQDLEELGADMARQIDEDIRTKVFGPIASNNEVVEPAAFKAGAGGTTWPSAASNNFNGEVLTIDDLALAYTRLDNKLSVFWPGQVVACVMAPLVKYDLFQTAAGQIDFKDWLATAGGQQFFQKFTLPVLAGCMIHTSQRNCTNQADGSAIPTGGGPETFGYGVNNGGGFYTWFINPGAYYTVTYGTGRPAVIIKGFNDGGVVNDEEALNRIMSIGIKFFGAVEGFDMERRFGVLATGASQS